MDTLLVKPHVSYPPGSSSILLINVITDTTESGEVLKVTVSDDRKHTTVDGLKVIQRDVLAANGKYKSNPLEMEELNFF